MLAVAALAAVSCGYHVAGQADTLPDYVRSIYIEPFTNATTEYKIEQHLTRAVTQEFLARTRYRVVDDAEQADARLSGVVKNVVVFPQIFDRATGRATTVQTVTQVHVALWDKRSGKALYQNPNFEFRQRYEVSTDPEAYFEERQAALQRSSDDLARSLVSAVLERF